MSMFDKIEEITQQVYEEYETCLQEADQFREIALNAYDSLEHAVEHGNYTDEVLQVYHRRVQTYAALATMDYARAAVIAP